MTKKVKFKSDFTRAQVLANRLKWIEFLENKRLRKETDVLDSGKGRCCLGHGAYALGIKRKRNPYPQEEDKFLYGKREEGRIAPIELINMVGLWTDRGDTNELSKITIRGIPFSNLSEANDDEEANIRPWEIGAYLRTFIEGGENTPFRPLTHYSE